MSEEGFVPGGAAKNPAAIEALGAAGASSLVLAFTTTDATHFGAFGVTPATRAAAYVQTYSTAARTVPAVLTDSTGGTPGTTLAAITNGANAGSADVGPVKDAIASLNARINTLAQVLNALIDDLQSYGLAQ